MKYEHDIYNHSMIYSYFLTRYISPIVSLIGVSLNSLILFTTMKKDNRKSFEKPQYIHMKLLSLSNGTFCFISLLNTFIERPYGLNGYFCSSLTSILLIKYFKVYFITNIQSTLKLFSDFAYFLFSMNRYLLVGDHHYEVFVRISKLDKKFCMFLSQYFLLYLDRLSLQFIKMRTI